MINKNFPVDNFKGFTLIELMVVVMVIAMSTGGALAAYLKFNEGQVIANDARQLSGEISRARTMASSLLYPPGCVNFTGVNVKSDESNTGLTITSQCGSGNFTETKDSLLKSTYFTLPVDITFLPGSGYLTTGTDAVIVITDTKSPPNTSTIKVGNYGSVDII